MRIARIIEYFPPHIGGMEWHGLILTQEQIKLGHEVDVFIGFGDRNILPNIRKAPLNFLPMYSKIRRFWFNFWVLRQVKKHHRENQYDVIHLHGDFIESYFGGKLSKKLGIPAVLTIHAGLNKNLLKPENTRYFSGVKKIICVSQEIADDLKIIGINRDKIEIISSGIYLDEFKNADENKIIDLRNRYSKPIIISIGVLRINKGFDYLIGAFKGILKKFSSAMLLIIGNGSEKVNLMKLAKRFGQIKFLGSRSHDEVIKYLKAADIFVLASVSTEGDREGTSTSIMEAMAAGLPVVATNIGGNPYLIKEGENGVLVEEKNSEALAKAVIKLISDENLRQKMREKNLEDAKQKDWPVIAKKITDVYEK